MLSDIIVLLRKNSKEKGSYASNKIEGNPLSEQQVNEVLDSDERKHFLKPEQEVREKAQKREKFSRKLILDVQKLVEKAASKEKIGLRGPMPPEYCDIPILVKERIRSYELSEFTKNNEKEIAKAIRQEI